MKTKKNCSLILAILIATFSHHALFAGGITLYELNSRSVGLASAGWAASAQDATTLFKNPAGMSLLSNSQLLISGQLLYGNVGLRLDSNTTVSGNNGGNPVGALPGGGVFFVYGVDTDLKFGLGAFSYFGLGQKFDEEWVGRYYLKEATLIGQTIMPSVSYRLSEQVSVGAGLNAMYGIFDQKIGVNNGGQQPDGQLKLNDHTWGFGADVGVLAEVSKGTRFGITYLSPVSLGFNTIPEFSGLRPAFETILQNKGLTNKSLDLTMKVPQSLMLSGYHEIDDKWAIMGNIGWQNWTQFGEIDVTVASDTPSTLTFNRSYKDTWHVAAGAQVQVSPEWLLTGGLAYDGSMVEDTDRTVDVAVGAAFRIGAGAHWQVNVPIRLGFAYELVWSGDLPVDQYRGPLAGRVSGAFDNSAIHFLNVSMEWNIQ